MQKAFISKNNPFNEHPSQGEQFSFTYLYPKYWFIWLFLSLTLLIAYLPVKIRAIMGTALGRLLFKFSKSKRDIARKIYEIKHIRDNAEKTEDIILVGRQCNEFRQLTNQLNINIANDLTSFRLTLERLYSLIR